MKKGFNHLMLVALLALIIVWSLFNFYIKNLPLMGRLDASVGCPLYSLPLGLSFFGSLFGCGFMSLFNIGMFLAFLAVLIITFKS